MAKVCIAQKKKLLRTSKCKRQEYIYILSTVGISFEQNVTFLDILLFIFSLVYLIIWY